MSNIGQAKVGDVTYNIAKASAVDQKRLLSLIGRFIALNSASAQVEKIDANMVYGVLLTGGETLLDQISDIVLYKCMESGGKDLITIDNFQNRVHEYYMLVAEAVGVNLNDFFTYLDSVNAEAQKASKETTH